MATTPQQVIINALVVLGMVFPGQTPGSSILNDSFTRLNNMLANWSVDRLMIYGIDRLEYTLTSGTNSYTIGTGGDFNTARPVSITHANIITPSLNLRYKLHLATTEEWGDIVDQSASGTIPTVLYDDYEYPDSTLYFWPTPNSSSTSVELFVWQQIEQFATLADTFDMPPGYEECVTYNLAMELSMVYGRPMSQEAMQVAMRSMANIKGNNAPPTHVSGAAQDAQAASEVSQAVANQPPNGLIPPIKR